MKTAFDPKTAALVIRNGRRGQTRRMASAKVHQPGMLMTSQTGDQSASRPQDSTCGKCGATFSWQSSPLGGWTLHLEKPAAICDCGYGIRAEAARDD